MRRFIFLFLCLAPLLQAFELEIAGGVNFLTFHPDRITAHTVSDNYKQFQNYPMGFGSLNMKFDLNEAWALGINAERDNVLFNSLDLILSARTDFFAFKFGPFAGMEDKLAIPDFGITGSIEFAFPGVIFISLDGTATLASKLDFTSNNSREAATVRIGFWLPSVIPSVSFNYKLFNRKPDDILTLTDTLYRFLGGIDIFSKRNSTVVKLEGGYQMYSRSYSRGSIKNIDELNCGFGGLEISWRLKNAWRLKVGAELPFAFNKDLQKEMPVPDFWRMPKFTAGFAYLGL